MIKERALWQGMSLDKKESVQGYLSIIESIGSDNTEDYYIELSPLTLKSGSKYERVDPDTVEHVAVKVVLKDKLPYCWREDEPLHSIHCPNCDRCLAEKLRDKTIKQTLMKHENKPTVFKAYCPFCGQRLDWSSEA